MVHAHGAKDGSLISTCKDLLLMRAICLLKVVDAVLLFIVMAVILFQQEVTFECRRVMPRVIRMIRNLMPIDWLLCLDDRGCKSGKLLFVR